MRLKRPAVRQRDNETSVYSRDGGQVLLHHFCAMTAKGHSSRPQSAVKGIRSVRPEPVTRLELVDIRRADVGAAQQERGCSFASEQLGVKMPGKRPPARRPRGKLQ